MKYTNVFLGLGSNLGDRNEYLRVATEMLDADEKVNVIRASTVIETEPVGAIAEGHFLNQVVEIETEYEPEELLKRCLDIEHSQGRIRERKWESRTLDIDILFFGDLVFHTESLQIPHPEIEQRAFVLQPMVEIAPDFKHPECNVIMRLQLDSGIVKGT